MPNLIDTTSVAWREKAHRIRGSVARQLDFVRRCEALQSSAIDDETFAELLSEVVEDLGLRKEQISEALEFNIASIYRWLSRTSMPLPFARPKLLLKVASLVREAIDDSLCEIVLQRRSQPRAAGNSLAADAALFLATPTPRILESNAPAELIALEGPFGRIKGAKRPTFAAFAWRGVGDFQLMPATAVTEAWVYFNGAGVSYYCHTKKRFVPVDIQDGVGRLLWFAAPDRKSADLPSIRLRSTGGLASGLLILSSADGVPYDLEEGPGGVGRAVIYPLRPNATSTEQPVTLRIALPTAAGMTHQTTSLTKTTENDILHNNQFFDHLKSLTFGNFELLQDKRHQELQSELRSRIDQHDKVATTAIDLTGVSPRIIVFNENSERFSDYATYICRHLGGEVIIPLYGSVNAHLFDKDAESATLGELAELNEFQLSQVIGRSDAYQPYLLLSSDINTTHLPGVVALNSNRTFHGFTALSRCAGFLALTVRAIGKSDSWVARSMVDHAGSNRMTGAR